MFTLLAEVHFWNSNDIEVHANDFSAIRHNEKKHRTESVYEEGKALYCEKRNSPSSSRKNVKLKELEEHLQQFRVVYSKWRGNAIFQIVTACGMVINVEMNSQSGCVEQIVFDNFFVGKLDSEVIVDVLILKSHIIFSYNENMIMLAHLSKPLKKRGFPEKLSRAEVQLHTQELSAVVGKCKLHANVNGDLLAIWRMHNGDEVQPWAPSNRDQTLVNISIYSLSRAKLELVCLYRTEFDPVCIAFNSFNTNILHSLEQKTSCKGVVTIETCSYEVQKSHLRRTIVTSIPLPKQVCCHCFYSANRKLILGCIDGSIVLFDQGKVTTHVVKTAFIPNMVSLNHDGSIILVANEQSQLQFFDVSLNAINVQMIGGEQAPTNVLDFSPYFKTRQTLSKLMWNAKPDAQYDTENFMPTDSMILLLYERGPFAVLKLISNTGVRSNIGETGYTPDVLINEYLSANQIDKAINVLLSLDWNFWGTICLISLNKIFNHLFRKPFTPEIEAQIQTALSSFHAPVKPLRSEIIREFEDSVKTLSRRFFHLLIRYQLFGKAFFLAVDIGDHDLFMDMNYYAWVNKDYELAIAAKNNALQLLGI